MPLLHEDENPLLATISAGEYLISCAVEDAIERVAKLCEDDMELSLIRNPPYRPEPSSLQGFPALDIIRLSQMWGGLGQNSAFGQPGLFSELGAQQAIVPPARQGLPNALAAGIFGLGTLLGTSAGGVANESALRNAQGLSSSLGNRGTLTVPNP